MKTVAEFLGNIRLASNRIYRGHASYDWELKSSLGREKISRPERLSTIEEESIADFKRMARPFLKPTQMPSSDDDWRALMQHHGCPTRLIDFTRNPLTALFFATDPTIDADGAVLVVNMGFWTDSTLNELAELKKPDHLTERITQQSGCFLKVSDAETPLTGSFLKKHRIDKAHKERLRKELAMMGICHSSLFPGLDGICNDLRDQIHTGIRLTNLLMELEAMAAAEPEGESCESPDADATA